jgi:NADP-dependent 3-hydroxy acid dehydrogenase YdfG
MAGLLDGTVALVTGASSGIGEAIANRTGGQGRRGGHCRSADRGLAALAATIHDAGGRVNAGVMLLGPAIGAPVEEWEQMVALNLQGLLWVTHGALPQLLAAGQDSPRGVADMVNISSVAGRTVRSGSGLYNATK